VRIAVLVSAMVATLAVVVATRPVTAEASTSRAAP
jgi:hypothetical protein